MKFQVFSRLGILCSLQKPEVSALLREISLDPDRIPSLIDKPELQFLKQKMEELILKTYPEAKRPE